MYDGHSHLDRWSVEVGKREARERLAAMPYETVTSYCFSKWWLDSKRQDWWPTSRGPLKQAFGVHGYRSRARIRLIDMIGRSGSTNQNTYSVGTCNCYELMISASANIYRVCVVITTHNEKLLH